MTYYGVVLTDPRGCRTVLARGLTYAEAEARKLAAQKNYRFPFTVSVRIDQFKEAR